MDRLRWPALLVATAVVVGACSSDDYLEEVSAIEGQRTAVLTEVGRVLRSAYTDRDRFLEAVAAASARGLEAALEDAEALGAPAEYADEHAAWLDTLRTTDGTLEEIHLGEDDLVGVLVAASEDFMAVSSFLIDVDPIFCRALTDQPASTEFFDPGLCIDPNTTPGGAYGLQARRAALRYPAEIAPRIGAPFSLVGTTDEELLRYLETIQPDVERIFAEIIDALGALDPPEALARDHAAALTYFEDMARIASEITAEVQRDDDRRLPGLFEESERPGRALDAALSDDGRVLFGTATTPE